ncbi:MAG: pseudouridine-5'-phosphate glycosidase [Myxococcaceae bacterium]|nr:pseudouridine-5'-phosphate glycosidase [Myxococcaceae bacterium]
MKLRFSQAVQGAMLRKRPLVALESSVIAQGLPRPQNLHAAMTCEAAVRAEGAEPATIAVIDGELCIGLEPEELQRLAKSDGLLKVGSRDLAVAVARRLTGGTTVSATCELAAAAGIRVFATGGLGGVHREVAKALDVSQDLPALARFPVAVVCAGAKSVLDLPKTMEALETLGVPVLGVGTNELPGFYTRETGIHLEHQVGTAEEAAEIARARVELGQGGLIFALPPPAATALPRQLVDKHLAVALREAKRKKIEGKQVTPFLLKAMAAATRGKTLLANLALLENNARFAGALAAAWRR